VESLRDNIAKDEDGDKVGDDMIGDRDRITSNKRIDAGIVNLDDEDI